MGNKQAIRYKIVTSRLNNGRTFQNMLVIKRKSSGKKTILRVIRRTLRYFKYCEEELLDFSDILLFTLWKNAVK